MPKATEHRITPARGRFGSPRPAQPPNPLQLGNPLQDARRRGEVRIDSTMFPNGPDPRAYAQVLSGDCLQPAVWHDDMAIVSPAAPLVPGRYVVLHFHQGDPQMKRLVLPPSPYASAPGDELRVCIIVEMLNPPRQFAIPTSRLTAIHAVVGVLKPSEYQARRSAPDAPVLPRVIKAATAHLGGAADGMDPADLATIEAMNAIMDRLCGARGQAPTIDPAEQARLLAEGRALNFAYTLALAALQRVGRI